MYFKDRSDAGIQLGNELRKQYGREDVVVYALPRGGVVTGFEVARIFHVPLHLVITRKIGHPNQPEFAIAAVSENGEVVGNAEQLANIDGKWLKKEIARQRKEAKRRRNLYAKAEDINDLTGKIAFIIDDGIATGLTIKAAIKEIQLKNPNKIIIVVPVAPSATIKELKKLIDDVFVLLVPPDFYAIGNFYSSFPQITDDEVINYMKLSKGFT